MKTDNRPNSIVEIHVESPEVLPLPLVLRMLRRLKFSHKLGVLERLYGRRLKVHGTTWVSCSNGIDWKLNLEDACHRWIVFGDYEGSVHLDWMRDWMSEGGIYIDSGANIGQMLLYIAPIPNVRSLAFEPLPEAMQWLRECVGRYEGDWNVTLVEAGLSDEPTRLSLKRSGAQSTMRQDWYTGKELEVIEVEVDTLDNQLQTLCVDHVRLWKLDVEGREVQALRGATESLRKALIDAIHVELCSPNLAEVRLLLNDAKYRLYSLGKTGELMEAPVSFFGTANLLALSPRVHDG